MKMVLKAMILHCKDILDRGQPGLMRKICTIDASFDLDWYTERDIFRQNIVISDLNYF